MNINNTMGKLNFISAFPEAILQNATFVLMRNEMNEFDVLMLEKGKTYPCGCVTKIELEEDIQDLSVLIGKFPNKVQSRTKFQEYEIGVLPVTPIKNHKTRMLLNDIKKGIDVNKNVRELASMTNMNRDLYVSLEKLYRENKWFEYNQLLKTFLKQFE